MQLVQRLPAFQDGTVQVWGLCLCSLIFERHHQHCLGAHISVGLQYAEFASDNTFSDGCSALGRTQIQQFSGRTQIQQPYSDISSIQKGQVLSGPFRRFLCLGSSLFCPHQHCLSQRGLQVNQTHKLGPLQYLSVSALPVCCKVHCMKSVHNLACEFVHLQV